MFCDTIRYNYWLLIALAIALCGSDILANAPTVPDYLRACEIGPDDFGRFRNDRQIAAEELDVIRRVAVRLRDCPADSLRGMMELSGLEKGQSHFRWDDSSPSDKKTERGRPVQFRGSVESIEAAGERLLRCTVTRPELPHRVIVYVANLPEAQAGEPVAVEGLLVKYVPGAKDTPVPVVVAPRLERRPPGALGELDFDRGLFDGVIDNAPLAAADSGAFYRLLALSKSADPAQLHDEATELDPAVAAAIFHDPAAERGRLIHVSGIARRVIKLPIDDPALATRLGTDHYYEIDLESEALQGNPLVFCTLNLPAGMPLGGPLAYSERVDLTGFFLKTWQYPTALTASEKSAHPTSAEALQTAPLVIGPTPRWIPVPVAKKNALGWVVGGLVALVITGLGLLLLHLRQSDQEFSAKSQLYPFKL